MSTSLVKIKTVQLVCMSYLFKPQFAGRQLNWRQMSYSSLWLPSHDRKLSQNKMLINKFRKLKLCQQVMTQFKVRFIAVKEMCLSLDPKRYC
jgi:hypothetical protein